MTGRSADELLQDHQKRRGCHRAKRRVCADLHIDGSPLRIGFVLGASPDDHVIACRITGGDPEEIDAGIELIS